MAAASSDSIRLWNRKGEALCTLRTPLIDTRGFRLACSVDGNWLAALSADNILLIWNLEMLEKRLSEISPAFRLFSASKK
jgi:hypothetical protein